jgi:glucuronoarabinoxylan endo-1,4-beta-xylanase
MANGSVSVTLPARSVTTFVAGVNGTSSPSPSASVSPTTVPTTTPPAGTAPRVTYTKSTWSTGFTANISITNPGSSTIDGWTLTFTLPSGQSITSGWNATYTPASGQVNARNVSYNATLAPGATTDIGFQATHTGNTAAPTAFTLNGIPCTVV